MNDVDLPTRASNILRSNEISLGAVYVFNSVRDEIPEIIFSSG